MTGAESDCEEQNRNERNTRGGVVTCREKSNKRGEVQKERRRRTERERGVVSLVVLSPSCMTHLIVAVFYSLGKKRQFMF